MGVEILTRLVAGNRQVVGARLRVARLTGRKAGRGRQRALHAKHAEGEFAVADIIEVGRVERLHRAAVKPDQAPRPDLAIGLRGIVRKPHIGPVAHRDETLHVKGELLPAEAQFHRAVAHRFRQGDETLL